MNKNKILITLLLAILAVSLVACDSEILNFNNADVNNNVVANNENKTLEDDKTQPINESETLEDDKTQLNNENIKLENNKETNNNKDKKLNLKDYAGKWSTALENTGKRTGVSITVKSEDTINFEYTVEQVSGMRIAVISIEDVKIDDNGLGYFKFDNDGHYNKGDGRIFLSDNKVAIEILNIECTAENPMWQIASGIYEINNNKDKKLNLKDYAGKWSTASENTGKGTGVLITVKSEDTINFEYTVEQVSGMRIAAISIEDVKIDDNGLGYFKFDNDGHYNKGDGRIFLSDNKVAIEILNIECTAENPMWQIASGTYEILNPKI